MAVGGVRVLLFGPLRDVAGWRERMVSPAPATLSALRHVLAVEDATLGVALNGASVKAAVNKAIVAGNPALAPSDEIAFLPPMSGG